MTHGPYIQYNSANIDYARKNRGKPTLAENKIWQEVLRKKQLGWKFTRQKPIGPFIVDFYCATCMLAVEIDGGIHNQQIIEDQHRTDVINDLGIIVVRYSNDDVINNIDEVRKDLMKRCQGREEKIF